MDNRPVGTRQARELLRVAFGPSVVALVVIAAVVLLQLLIANSDMTGALGAIASMWLGVHQVPVSIGGSELGVMPLLPVLAMVWGTARTTAAATSPQALLVRHALGRRVGAGRPAAHRRDLAGRHPRRGVGADRTADAERAARVRRRAGRARDRRGDRRRVAGRPATAGRRRRCLPGCPTRSARPAAGVLALLGLSGVVMAGSMVVHWATMHDLYAITDSVFGQFSLTLLSVLYMPERDRRHRGGRRRLQRARRVGDVQFVHRVRR